MRKVVQCFGLVIVMMVVLFFLGGCTEDEADLLYEALVGDALGEANQPEVSEEESPAYEEDAEESHANVEDDGLGNDEEIGDLPIVESDLAGTLHIVTSHFDAYLPLMARRFRRLHPNVEITFEKMDHVFDISQQVALATRLMAEPPDIINIADLVFEKFSSEAMFVDLNPLIDGEKGIDREIIFNQFLTGAEENGALFHLPLLVRTESVMMNKAYFAAIGVDITEIESLTLDEIFGYWQQANELFPEDEIRITTTFNMLDIFRFEQGYNLVTGEVNVNTPRMRELFELAKMAPRGSVQREGNQVEYTPEGLAISTVITEFGGATGGVVDPTYFAPTTNAMYHQGMNPDGMNLVESHIFLVAEHPDMKFSHPVHITSQQGEIFFRSHISPAILRGSENQELAWEFLRFCLEDTGPIVRDIWELSPITGYHFPINRRLFEDTVRAVIDFRYQGFVRFGVLEETGTPEEIAENRARLIEESLEGFTRLVSAVNTENRVNWVVLHSLIYPDIYLLMSGQQDVDITLYNLQNRLELYVAE